MDFMLSKLFIPDIAFLEIFVRGSCTYLGAFIILRVILKREVGSIGIPDLLMLTLIADAAQNGMAGEYHSITSGLSLISTLVFWNFVLDWMTSRFPWFEKLTEPGPLCLVRSGRIQRKNLKNAYMTTTI